MKKTKTKVRSKKQIKAQLRKGGIRASKRHGHFRAKAKQEQ